MPIKDIAPIIAKVTYYDVYFASDSFFPNSACSSHEQYGQVWKFIMRFPQAVSTYPFQSIRNMTALTLDSCGLEGISSSFFPWRRSFYFHVSCVLSYQSYNVTYFLFVFTVFCIPQVPFRLNWANWKIYGIWIYPKTSLTVLLHLLSFDLCSLKEWACFPYALSYQSDRVTCCL